PPTPPSWKRGVPLPSSRRPVILRLPAALRENTQRLLTRSSAPDHCPDEPSTSHAGYCPAAGPITPGAGFCTGLTVQAAAITAAIRTFVIVVLPRQTPAAARGT